MKQIAKLFGKRIALELAEEVSEGLIVPPPNKQKIHVLSKVIAVGNEVTNLKPDDIVFWQTNAMIEYNSRYQLNGKVIYVLLTGDMVAKLDDRRVRLENFHCIGDWCLVRKEKIEQSRIIVPDAVADANQDMLRFYLVQKGETVELDLKEGEEIMPDRTRGNPIKIGDQDFFYIHKNFIVGALN